MSSKAKLYGKAKVFHLTVPIVSVPGLMESGNDKEKLLGFWDGATQAAHYDPKAPDPIAVIVHELLGHGIRYTLGIGDPADKTEEEKATGLVELSVCTFVRDNPKLSMKILRDLLGEKVWQQALKSMKP